MKIFLRWHFLKLFTLRDIVNLPKQCKFHFLTMSNNAKMANPRTNLKPHVMVNKVTIKFNQEHKNTVIYSMF